MRGDQQAVDLLVGVVGEREHSQAIDLTPAIERYRSDGDLIQISTAPGKDGIVLDRAGLRRGEDQPDEGGEAGEDE
jgi:hypothetical protein